LNTFARHGFEVIEDRPMGLFYTGHMLFADRISFPTRGDLSRSLGSATRVYVVRPLGAGERPRQEAKRSTNT
jgi:hypothetical protein